MSEPEKNPMTEDQKKAVELVSKRYDIGKEAWREWYQKMRLALHYYLGDQYAWLDQDTGDLSSPTDLQVRAVYKQRKMILVRRNKIMPAVDVLVSRLTQREPGLTAAPVRNDQSARDKAKLNKDVLAYFRMRKDYGINDERNARWVVICGKGYKWVHPVKAPAEYRLTAQGMEPLPERYEIQVSVLVPFQVIRPPRITELDKCPWLIIWQLCDPSEIKANYPKFEYDPETDREGEHTDEEITDAMLLTGEKLGNARIVKEYLELPTAANPAGRHVVIADGQLLDDGPFPNWDEQMAMEPNPEAEKARMLTAMLARQPGMEGQQLNLMVPERVPVWTRRCGGYRITEFNYRETLLSPAALGLVYPLIDPQRKLNLLYSQWHTNRVLTMSHKLKLPKGQKMPGDFWDNYPSHFEWDDSKGKPEWLQQAQTPQDLDKLIERDEKAFEEESGVHPLTLGNEPLQRSPYLAIQHLIHVDMDKFTPLFNRYGQGEARVANHIIAAVKQFCSWLFYYVQGEDKMPDPREIKTDDLGDIEIKFERDSTIPESETGRVADLMDLLKQGAIQLTNKAQMISYMRAVDTTWSRTFMDAMESPLVTAEAENKLLLAGQRVPVSPFHDDEVHLFGHLPLYDSPESIGRITPEIEEHLMAHNQSLAAKQGRPVAPGQEQPGAEAGAPGEAALQEALQPPGQAPGGMMATTPPLELAGGGPAMPGIGAMQ